MMNSMTGFGRAELSTKLGLLTAETSSVNNRFLDLTIRLPRQYAALEVKVRELVAEYAQRGQVTVNVGLEESADSPDRYHINEAAVRAYVKQMRVLQKELKMTGEIRISDLLILPDVAKPDRERLDLDEAWRGIEKVIRKAMTALVAMRHKEGRAMAADMQRRLDSMAKVIAQIQKKTVNSVDVYRLKLSERIAELLEPPQRNGLRLEEEVALFASRTDISEECTRFLSHIEQYHEALRLKEPVGKRLNFIQQEMNREANTIGSKCSDFNITSLVISLKEEVEKLREMAQNVE